MTDTAPAMKLTPARRRALLVLADRHGNDRCARISNVTDEDAGYVYWQSAAWLVEAGLARPIDGATGWPSSTYLRITQAGLDQLAET